MTTSPSDPSQGPMFAGSPPKRSHTDLARSIGDLVRTAVVILFWGIVGCAALAAAFLAVRAIYFALQLALRALEG